MDFNRMGFTRREATVLFVLIALFLIGSGAMHYRRLHTPLPEIEDVQKAVIGLHNSRADSVSKDFKDIEVLTRISINNASSELLQGLKGIGPELASRIVAYRQKHGKFSTLHDIQNVRGIGPKTFQKLEPFIML